MKDEPLRALKIRTISMTTSTSITTTTTTLRFSLKGSNHCFRSGVALFACLRFWQNTTRCEANSSPSQSWGTRASSLHAPWYACTRLGRRFGAGRGPGSHKQQSHFHPKRCRTYDQQGIAAFTRQPFGGKMHIWKQTTLYECTKCPAIYLHDPTYRHELSQCPRRNPPGPPGIDLGTDQPKAFARGRWEMESILMRGKEMNCHVDVAGGGAPRISRDQPSRPTVFPQCVWSRN